MVKEFPSGYWATSSTRSASHEQRALSELLSDDPMQLFCIVIGILEYYMLWDCRRPVAVHTSSCAVDVERLARSGGNDAAILCHCSGPKPCLGQIRTFHRQRAAFMEWISSSLSAIERSRDPDTWDIDSRPLINITIMINTYQ